VSPQVADAVCERCEGRGWILEDDGAQGTAVACQCQADSVIPRLLAQAGIPDRYRRCTFDNFQTTDPDQGRGHQLLAARSRAQRYVDEFITESGRFAEHGLLFSGPTGVGKTHLAVAVIACLIEKYRAHARFTDCTALIHRLQSTFEPGSSRGKQEILNPILEAEILVLDDLGAQKQSDWVSEILYLVLNERYSSRSPTIVTTNLRLDPGREPSTDRLDSSDRPRPRRESMEQRLPASLVSRLHEMTRVIRIEAGDFRQEVKSLSTR
jgi:DNA replication protein DnaC